MAPRPTHTPMRRRGTRAIDPNNNPLEAPEMYLSPDQRRCHQCGFIIYAAIWLEDAPPSNKCPWGHPSPTNCYHALSRAQETANLIKAGVIPAKEP